MPRASRPLLADGEHVGVDVGDRHRGAAPGHAEGDVAGAAGHVEDRLAGARLHPRTKRCFHSRCMPARHQVVHQVVAAATLS